MSPPKSGAAKSSPAVFGPGSLVEVSSDDEGFRGSWYSGIVIRRIGDQFLVEYDHLLADEDGSERLREELSLPHLRPLPPADTCREFKFGDPVDAFYNDGWWEGYITMELQGERFMVYFRGAREQLEFSKEQLRVHREWVDGNWDPPFEQQEDQEEVLLTPNRSSNNGAVRGEEEEKFGVGKLVEVSSDEEGFLGAWFSAIVVQVVAKNKFLVEYQTLLDDDSSLLKEEVDILHIRPHPPETRAAGEFSCLEEVDALYNDGWWVGVIAKVLGNSRYIVYFRSSDEELEFPGSQLRKHQDWVGGKWIKASKVVNL